MKDEVRVVDDSSPKNKKIKLETLQQVLIILNFINIPEY